MSIRSRERRRRAGVWLVGLAALMLTGTSMAETENARIVSVNGQGEISAEPDKAFVTLGVEARNADKATARREVEKTVRAFLELCKELDIEDRYVRTAQLSIQPEYDWSKSQQRRLIGYYVNRRLEVDLRELEKLGELIERATDAGANQAQPPRFDSSRKDELTREALAEAARDARTNAEVLARTLGAEVGPVRRITSHNVGYQQPPMRPMMAERSRSLQSSAPSGADTYTAGEIKFTAQINAEFDLLVK